MPCDVRDFPHREGVTLEQKLALRSRKRVKQDESEEEKWYRAYAILFRYDDDTAYPSPCTLEQISLVRLIDKHQIMSSICSSKAR